MNDLDLAHRALMDVMAGHRLREIPQPRAANLAIGVLRQITALEWLRGQLFSKPLPRKHTDVGVALLMGLYQIRHMRTPNHAAVQETVNLARTLKKSWATGLLNATLRRYLREREALDAALAEDDAFFRVGGGREGKREASVFEAHSNRDETRRGSRRAQ